MTKKHASKRTPAPKRAELQARRLREWTLRQGGASIQQIATTLGVAVGTVARDLEIAAEEVNEAIKDKVTLYREVEGDRLDRLLLSVWGRAIGRQAPDGSWIEPPDLHAVDRVLKIIQQRTTLYGLNVPVEQTLKIDDWHTQAIADIRAKNITFKALAEAFDAPLALQLFAEAGVEVELEYADEDDRAE